MTVEEAIEIWKKTKSPYLKRDMEKFIHFYGMLYKYGVRKVCEYRSDSSFEKTYGFFTF